MSNDFKMVSAQMSNDEVRILDAAKKVKKGYSRADIIREGSLIYARQILTNLEQEQQALEALIAKADIVREPVPIETRNAPRTQDVRDEAPVDNPDTYGPPTACPCCGSKVNELGEPQIAAVKSGSDWGAWGCHECGSNGRWYDNQSWTILMNNCAAADLPLGKEDSTASV